MKGQRRQQKNFKSADTNAYLILAFEMEGLNAKQKVDAMRKKIIDKSCIFVRGRQQTSTMSKIFWLVIQTPGGAL